MTYERYLFEAAFLGHGWMFCTSWPRWPYSVPYRRVFEHSSSQELIIYLLQKRIASNEFSV